MPDTQSGSRCDVSKPVDLTTIQSFLDTSSTTREKLFLLDDHLIDTTLCPHTNSAGDVLHGSSCELTRSCVSKKGDSENTPGLAFPEGLESPPAGLQSSHCDALPPTSQIFGTRSCELWPTLGALAPLAAQELVPTKARSFDDSVLIDCA